MNRRAFLATTPALLTAVPSPPRPRPNKPLKAALIGTGWYGKMDLLRLLQVAEDTEVVALCDVDQHQLIEAKILLQSRFPRQNPRLFHDHRELLAATNLDIVLIETPDHWHALQAIDCLRAGADLYLQKPVGVDVRECEAVLDAARRENRVVQVALQRRSTPHLVQAKEEIVDAGLLGDIGHVEMCCYYHMRDTAQRAVQPVPDFFNYDRWTGPAPLLPFKGLPHRRWRAFQAYGNGIVGDMCVHMFDQARWMLDLGWPARVSSQGGIFVQTEADATTTDTQTAVFEYPDRGFNCVWQHRSWGAPVDPDFPWGLFLYGSKGTLSMSPHKYHFTPHKAETVVQKALLETERFPEDVTEEGIELHAAPATRRHLVDFLRAVERREQPVADIHDAYVSSASCVLANIARDIGRPVVYDPVARTLLGEEDALLSRDYREGYVHP